MGHITDRERARRLERNTRNASVVMLTVKGATSEPVVTNKNPKTTPEVAAPAAVAALASN
jgi:hypothetical protein